MNPFLPLPCVSLDCVFPSDLELYGLQGPNGPWSWLAVQFSNYPYDPTTGLVRVPVPGFGGFEWINPGLIPIIFSAQSGVFSQRLRCCDGSYILVTITAGMAPAARTALLQRAFAAIAQKQAYCNRLTKIAATNRPKPYNPSGLPARPLKLQPFSGGNSNTTGACIGIPFTKSIAALGQSIPPYTFGAPTGGIPPGLQESENLAGTVYTLSGRPTVVGNYVFLLQVVDSATPANVDTQQYEIDVMGITNSPPNSNGEIPMPDAQIGYPYVEQLTAGGGTGPYTFIEDPEFLLPGWLTLSSSGLLTGTPTASESDLFGVIFTDSKGATCRALINVQVYDVHFTNYPPPGGITCSAYSFTFTAAPNGCTFAGTCPPGLTINSAGVVSGKPTSVGVQQFNITATDSHGRHATQQWTVNISDGLAGFAASVQDLVYVLSKTENFGGTVGSNVASGGNLNFSGNLVTPGNGTAQIDDRWLNGIKICAGNASYQLNFAISYQINCSSVAVLGKNPRLGIKISMQGDGSVCNQTIHPASISESGLINGTVPSGWTEIDQASSLFHISLQSDALAVADTVTATVTVTITPVYPP